MSRNNRNQRAKAAKQTLDILEQGMYKLPNEERVDINTSLANCVENTVLIRPEDELAYDTVESFETQFFVKNQTTIQACLDHLNGEPLICLNFASARNPGGGFLGGSQAQEESLARASGLYKSQTSVMEMYEANRENRSLLYLDYMIYSPAVPFFKDEEDVLLAEPYEVSVITAPAPNRGAIAANQPERLAEVSETMSRRIQRVLALALKYGYRQIVLGAWGCGVFRNDPVMVAEHFYQQLKNGGAFEGKFKKVIFGVLDRTKGTVFPEFEKRFGNNG
ncbi:MAG: TIGR02452 family protein [Bacteroidota bacterium]